MRNPILEETEDYIVIGNEKQPNMYCFVDSDSIDKIKDFRWSLHGSGYVVTTIGSGKESKTIFMHHVILGTKPNPLEYQPDHIDRNKQNNRKSNLRIVSPHANYMNTKAVVNRISKGNFPGVRHKKNFYESSAKLKDKYFYLGNFISAETASLARDRFLLNNLSGEITTNYSLNLYSEEFLVKLKINSEEDIKNIPDSIINDFKFSFGPNKSSKYVGVSFNERNKWSTRYKFNCKYVYTKTGFETDTEAAIAREKFLDEHPEYVKPVTVRNFIPEDLRKLYS